MTQYMLDKAFKNRLRLPVSMSYRVTIAGRTVEMDSPEEVYRLLQSTTVNGRHEVKAAPKRQEWDDDRAAQFMADLQPGSLQMQVIWTLYHLETKSLSRDDLLAMMKISDAQQLGGAFSGLIKNAKKLGAPSPLFIKRIRDTKGNRTYEYSLDPAFRKAVEHLEPAEPESDLPGFRDYIATRRAALAGFMSQGAHLALVDDVLKVTPKSSIYVRYLNDNLGVLAELVSAYYERPIRTILTPVPATATKAKEAPQL